MMQAQKIVVIGTGYVGLPAALLLARAGHSVVGVDINDNIVRAINDGVLHINEAALQAIMDEPAVRAKPDGAGHALRSRCFFHCGAQPAGPAQEGGGPEHGCGSC